MNVGVFAWVNRYSIWFIWFFIWWTQQLHTSVFSIDQWFLICYCQLFSGEKIKIVFFNFLGTLPIWISCGLWFHKPELQFTIDGQRDAPDAIVIILGKKRCFSWILANPSFGDQKMEKKRFLSKIVLKSEGCCMWYSSIVPKFQGVVSQSSCATRVALSYLLAKDYGPIEYAKLSCSVN